MKILGLIHDNVKLPSANQTILIKVFTNYLPYFIMF